MSDNYVLIEINQDSYMLERIQSNSLFQGRNEINLFFKFRKIQTISTCQDQIIKRGQRFIFKIKKEHLQKTFPGNLYYFFIKHNANDFQTISKEHFQVQLNKESTVQNVIGLNGKEQFSYTTRKGIGLFKLFEPFPDVRPLLLIL